MITAASIVTPGHEMKLYLSRPTEEGLPCTRLKCGGGLAQRQTFGSDASILPRNRKAVVDAAANPKDGLSVPGSPVPFLYKSAAPPESHVVSLSLLETAAVTFLWYLKVPHTRREGGLPFHNAENMPAQGSIRIKWLLTSMSCSKLEIWASLSCKRY